MKTVLLVEDTEDLRRFFSEVLTSAGYRVIGVENGQEALEMLETMDEPPCLVLLDMMMPVMDGKTFLQQLQASHRVAALPVVVASAIAGEEHAGAQRVLRKPVSPQLLTELVREFCGAPER
jgi:two-component system, chemotaxis family, chemotaxis protein CheY